MRKETKDALLFAAPFLVWIGLQTLLPATAAAYAARAAATAAVGVVCLWGARRGAAGGGLDASAPFAASARAAYASVAVGVLAGLAVCVLWIAPERWTWYRLWCVLPLGGQAAAPAPSPYDPAVCGWGLTLAKLAGSAFVIAPAEEVFFRSFVYRRLQARDFRAVPRARFDLSAFLWTVFLFMLEHDRPAAAALAGAVYGAVAIRCGLGAAILAHVVTNFALGAHVIARGEWGFW